MTLFNGLNYLEVLLLVVLFYYPNYRKFNEREPILLFY